jgi:hypothetical protein
VVWFEGGEYDHKSFIRKCNDEMKFITRPLCYLILSVM